jgi:hypothetical protein
MLSDFKWNLAHSGYLIVDVLGTIGLAWLLVRFTGMDFVSALIIMFIAGSALHALFGVRTKFTEFLTRHIKKCL